MTIILTLQPVYGIGVDVPFPAAPILLTLAPAIAGRGVPPGGLTGQVLRKASNADFDTEWHTPDPQLVFGEVPAGAVNGINTAFTLAASPRPSANCRVWMQYATGGAWFPRFEGIDFTVAGNVLTFAVPPNAPSTLRADYTT